MAAYAAVVSLLNTVQQIMDHPPLSTSLHRDEIESLQEKAGFLLDFIERYNFHGVMSKEAHALETQIASAAHAAEDIIESRIVDLIQNGEIASDSKTKRKAMRRKVNKFRSKMQEIIQDMDSIKEKLNKFKEEARADTEEQPMLTASSRTPITTVKHCMVGFDEELIQLMDVLTGQQTNLQIVPIVGMGGSGKTTLARNLYENSVITQHFDVCAWTTISQEYNVREIFLELLSRKGTSSSEAVDGLGEKLHKTLFGRRYLIVLDDMWSVEAWDKMKFFFPNNSNGSRVVITTRLSNLAIHICGSTSFRMKFLDEGKSWNLFCQKVFGEEECPPELVEIGKKIVEQCRGLPLSIVVIGGALRKSNRTGRYWRDVAKNINLILRSRENEQCLDILYLSYSHLPAHLKPCFLYMGIFKEDHEIRVSELIKLWVAEGFLRENGKILEDTAEGYIEDLGDRNLILACKHLPNGKIRSFRLHDLLRELCLKVAERESFFCIARENSIPRDIGSERRLIFYGLFNRDHQKVFEVSQSAQLARSLTCEITEAPIKFKLLRVLNKATNWCTDAQFQNVNLRYFAYQPWLQWSDKLPSSISLIWNLQTLIITHYDLIVAPLEIWKMRKLRHLKCSQIFLPEPPPPSDRDDEPFVLENLQTLSTIVNFKWNEEVCKRIPNIRKLHLFYCSNYSLAWDDRLQFNLHNVGDLQKLASLHIWYFASSILEVKNTFPSSLKRLVLIGRMVTTVSIKQCILRWEDMTMIGSLPLLEYLKLGQNAVVGNEWSPVDGGFLRLKILKIKTCHLICWNAEGSHFPVLEKLVLHRLWQLNEIPLSFGEIPTLQRIRLTHCGDRVSISGIRVKEEQESFGNYGLQIQVRAHASTLEEIRKTMELEGWSSTNVQLLER